MKVFNNALISLVLHLLSKTLTNATPVPAVGPDALSERGCCGSDNDQPQTQPQADTPTGVVSKQPLGISSMERPDFVTPDDGQGVPTVETLLAQIKKDPLTKYDILFYSGLGNNKVVQANAIAWHKKNAQKPIRTPMTFDDLAKRRWYQTYGSKYIGMEVETNMLQNRLAQAFAMAASGRVYFFGSTVNNIDEYSKTSAWGGWEYPALTRNPDITEIWKVDPTLSVKSASGGSSGTVGGSSASTSTESLHDQGELAWKKGMGPSLQVPRGNEILKKVGG